MPTVTGTFLRSDGTPSSGSVAFAPSVAIGDGTEVRLPAPCEVHLDATGSIEVTLPATNDPDYTPSGWVWQVRERIAGGRDAWHFELTADTDYWDLVTVTPPEDYLPWTFTATATTGAPGTDADVDVTGTPPAPVFEFTIPRGDVGPVAVEFSPTAPTAPAVGLLWVDSDGTVETFIAPWGPADIADGAIIATKLGAGAVGTPALADGAVTTAKLAANAAVIVSPSPPVGPVPVGLLWVDSDG